MPKRRPGRHQRRPGGAADPRGPGRGHRRVDAVHPARREVDERPVPAGERDPCGLGRQHRLAGDPVEQPRLDELGLDERRGHPHEGLAREHDLALGHGPHVAREPQVGEVVEERRGEGAQAGEVGHVTLVVAPALEPGEGVVEPAATRNRRSSGRLRTNSSKVASWVDAAGLVGRGHRELVEVGDEAPTAPRAGRAPCRARGRWRSGPGATPGTLVTRGPRPRRPSRRRPAARPPARARRGGCRRAARWCRTPAAARRARSP